MIQVKSKLVQCNVEVQRDYVVVTIVVETVLNVGLGVLNPILTKSVLKYPRRLLSMLMTRDSSEKSVLNVETVSN